jgi:hypothetical protein
VTLRRPLPSDTRYLIVQFAEVQLLALNRFADQADIALAADRGASIGAARSMRSTLHR